LVDLPPIALVHGTRFTRSQWQPVLAPLAAEFPVTTVDLPGHGTRSAEPWDLDRAADLIAAAVRDLGAGPAVVVGHSLGGYVSVHFAHRHPDLLAGLVLMGASAATSGPLTVPYRLVAALVERLPADRLTRWNDRLLRRLYPPEVVDAAIADGYAFHTLPIAWRDVLGRFDASSLAPVRAPVLILNGQRDLLFRSGERAFARARPGTRIELIPGAAHLTTFDAPAAVADAVGRFARQVSPAA
jgi:pimeloyl-ACP methyl ester carboxylesterase